MVNLKVNESDFQNINKYILQQIKFQRRNLQTCLCCEVQFEKIIKQKKENINLIDKNKKITASTFELN